MIESCFSKASGFYAYDSKKVCGGACFYLQTVVDLFVVKLQVFTINDNEQFCDGVCDRILF